MFLIAPWSSLPHLALSVQEEFKKFTSCRVNLSGGIFLAPSKKFPVYQAAKMAGKAERLAKKEPEKNRITFFDEAMKWTELEECEKLKKSLVKLLLPKNGSDEMPRSLLGTLSAAWQRWKILNNQKNGQKQEIFESWTLIYQFARIWSRKPGSEQKEELENLLKKIVSIDKPQILAPHLGVAVRWADYLTRKGKEER